MTVLALTIAAVSVVVLRTRILWAWVGHMGLVCALVILGAVAAMVGAFAIPMALVWAVALGRRDLAAAAVAVPAHEPATLVDTRG